jgi:hypothetical protein
MTSSTSVRAALLVRVARFAASTPSRRPTSTSSVARPPRPTRCCATTLPVSRSTSCRRTTGPGTRSSCSGRVRWPRTAQASGRTRSAGIRTRCGWLSRVCARQRSTNPTTPPLPTPVRGSGDQRRECLRLDSGAGREGTRPLNASVTFNVPNNFPGGTISFNVASRRATRVAVSGPSPSTACCRDDDAGSDPDQPAQQDRLLLPTLHESCTGSSSDRRADDDFRDEQLLRQLRHRGNRPADCRPVPPASLPVVRRDGLAFDHGHIRPTLAAQANPGATSISVNQSPFSSSRQLAAGIRSEGGRVPRHRPPRRETFRRRRFARLHRSRAPGRSRSTSQAAHWRTLTSSAPAASLGPRTTTCATSRVSGPVRSGTSLTTTWSCTTWTRTSTRTRAGSTATSST